MISPLCCCPIETPADHEAHISSSLLKSNPIPIWWHRRRIHGAPAFLSENDCGQTKGDRSPFPKSWSAKYSGNNVDGFADHIKPGASLEKSESASFADTEESSIFSSASHEQGLDRDAFGNCVNHPQIQLARKTHTSSPIRHLRSRFTTIFFTRLNDSSTEGGDEWDIIHVTCPECEKERVEKSKALYQYKPKKAERIDRQPNNSSTYQSFPAKLTIITSHSHLEEGSWALRVRTEPIPTEETMHSSCAAATSTARGGSVNFWKWNTPNGKWTPNGAMDFIFPCDVNGETIQVHDKILQDQNVNSGRFMTPAKKQTNVSHYQIMERIIPLSSIDHISRGGDAWDILRQSTGENDIGCCCDVKIHGYNDRLLRFDVIDFEQGNENSARLRYSYGAVDFSQFSITSFINNSSNGSFTGVDVQANNGALVIETHSESCYTTENVISMLNSIVSWDRLMQKRSVASWMRRFTNWIDEYLSLGVPKEDGIDIAIR